MSFDSLLTQLVGAYIPQDATNLPYDDQRVIVHELTGYWASDANVIRRYLANPDLVTLVDDTTVMRSMEIENLPYILANLQNLRDYVRTKDRAVFAREAINFDLLEGEEDYRELLMRAGTMVAFNELQRLVGGNLDNIEHIPILLGALTTGDHELLTYLDEHEIALTDETDYLTIVDLTQQQITHAVEHEKSGSDDYTVFFIPAFYDQSAVEPFLFYMHLWDEKSRSAMMSNLPGFVNSDALNNGGPEFDIDNPVIQAYLQEFPDDEASEAIRDGGEVALKQINYPDFISEYSQSRGGQYQAEQRYRSLLQYQYNPMIRSSDIEEARQEVNAYRRANGQEEIPPL